MRQKAWLRQLPGWSARAPQWLCATRTRATNVLGWRVGGRRTSYTVERKEPNGRWTRIGTSTKGYFLDESPGGRSPTYRVRTPGGASVIRLKATSRRDCTPL